MSGIAEHRIVSEISGFHGILKCEWVAGRQYGNYFLPYNRNKINTISSGEYEPKIMSYLPFLIPQYSQR